MEQINDVSAALRNINYNVKDETLLVRVYNIGNGSDVWIDGLSWRLYDYDIVEYFAEECGVVVPKNVKYEVIDAIDDWVWNYCTQINNIFSTAHYEELQGYIEDFEEDVVKSAIELDISLESIENAYIGKFKNFKEFAQDYIMLNIKHEIPEHLFPFFDEDAYAEYLEEDYLYDTETGCLFSANY